MICSLAAFSLAALFTIPARAQDFVVAKIKQRNARPDCSHCPKSSGTIRANRLLRKIWAAPGTGAATTAPASWQALAKDDIAVRITSTQLIGGEKWIRVRFEKEVCGRSYENVPALEGWLPAYRTARNTSVWFWSRGC